MVTDPPYKLVQGGTTNKAVRLTGATDLKSGSVFKYNSIKFAEWLPEIYRVLKEGTHCYVMVNDRNMLELLTEAEKAKFKLLNILTWKKSKHAPNRYYLKNSEFIVLLRKGRAKNINNMGTYQVLEVDNVGKKRHPSEKPVELMSILINNSSNENEVVLDPFLGSGTSAVSAIINNRNFIGVEQDWEYCEIAYERIKQAKEILIP